MNYNWKAVLGTEKLLQSVLELQRNYDKFLVSLESSKSSSRSSIDATLSQKSKTLHQEKVVPIENEISGIQAILDRMTAAESLMDESFFHLKDDEGRSTEKVIVDVDKDVLDQLTELDELADKLFTTKEKYGKQLDFLTKLLSKAVDFLKDRRNELTLKQRAIGSLIIFGVLYFPLKRLSGFSSSIQYIIVGLLVGVGLAYFKFRSKLWKNSVYGNTSRVYKIYNIIDHVKLLGELELVRLAKVKQDAIDAISSYINSQTTKSYAKLDTLLSKKSDDYRKQYLTQLSSYCGKSLEEYTNHCTLVDISIEDIPFRLSYDLSNVHFICSQDQMRDPDFVIKSICNDLVSTFEDISVHIVDTVDLGTSYTGLLKSYKTVNVVISESKLDDLLDKFISQIDFNNREFEGGFEDYISENPVDILVIRDTSIFSDPKLAKKLSTVFKFGHSCGIVSLVVSTEHSFDASDFPLEFNFNMGENPCISRMSGIDVKYQVIL